MNRPALPNVLDTDVRVLGDVPVPKWARIGLLTVGALVMFLGPYDRQVLRNSDHVWFKAWRMYSLVSIENCVAEYVVRDPDGTVRPVDRLAVLYGVSHWSRATSRERTLRDDAAVRDAGLRMCRELGAKVVLADARCASLHGWEVVEDRTRNLCRSTPRVP